MAVRPERRRQHAIELSSAVGLALEILTRCVGVCGGGHVGFGGQVGGGVGGVHVGVECGGSSMWFYGGMRCTCTCRCAG